MKKKKAIITVVTIPSLLLVSSVICMIISHRFSDFFFVPLHNIINIAIMIGFAYFLTQYTSDERKQKEFIEKLLQKIIDDITKPEMYEIKNSNSIAHIRIIQKTIDNRLFLLQEYAEKYKFSDELQQSTTNFKDYWEMISEHIENFEYLKESQTVLFNYISNMNFNLEKINSKIYKWI